MTRIKFRLMVSGTHEAGHIITTTAQLLDGGTKKLKNGPGNFIFKEFQLNEVPSFTDYLSGGWQISFAVAIDFTASNGNPQNPNSLHFLGESNPYM